MSEPVLIATGIVKHHPTSRGLVRAVDGVDIHVNRGETVGLVGESGCGKSTLGRVLMRLSEPDKGSISLDGHDITELGRRAMRPHRAKLQMIFQDPFASLNPRATVGRILAEPMIVHRRHGRRQRQERIAWLLERVGLRPEAAGRYPHEFSGGQRQRIGIARALALDPKLIICDEPVSALDVSVRAQVINLLGRLRDELGVSYLFISHDLSVVQHLADRIAVMYLGLIVETADRASLWRQPLHPYTKALVAAVPLPDPARPSGESRLLDVEPPSPLAPPAGCRFHTRCPVAVARCREEVPALRDVAPSRRVACHLV